MLRSGMNTECQVSNVNAIRILMFEGGVLI